MNEITIEQYRVKSYFIDLIFSVHKIGIEIDEYSRIDRCRIKEIERQQTIKEETGFKIIRTNPDKEDLLRKLVKYKNSLSNRLKN